MSDTDKPTTDLGERFPKSTDEMTRLKAAGAEDAKDLAAYLDRSPTPFHAVRESVARLTAAGFSELSEADAWSVKRGDRRFVVRGGSTLVAFVAGDVPPSRGGFTMIGAHTDSPNLRVKPNADTSARGYQQLGVEVYGGVLLTTWLDRDLSIAGRVHFERAGKLESALVDFSRAVGRVPNLAIHLNRNVNSEGLVLNAQRHMVPVVGLGKEAVLKKSLGAMLEVKPDAIMGYDLAFYDTKKAEIGGLEGEFIWSARLDNLASCHAAVRALVATAGDEVPATRLIVLYDHEEVGSRSAVGACGPVLRDAVARIADSYTDAPAQSLHRALARSWLISADMAHAVHPNYDDKHEPHHQPVINRGLVIKSNANQSYATDGATSARFEALASAVGYAPQRFVVRSDLPCGSTIGPITAAELGIATVDVGGPMLSMHSCREMAGTLDVHLTIATFERALRG